MGGLHEKGALASAVPTAGGSCHQRPQASVPLGLLGAPPPQGASGPIHGATVCLLLSRAPPSGSSRSLVTRMRRGGSRRRGWVPLCPRLSQASCCCPSPGARQVWPRSLTFPVSPPSKWTRPPGLKSCKASNRLKSLLFRPQPLRTACSSCQDDGGSCDQGPLVLLRFLVGVREGGWRGLRGLGAGWEGTLRGLAPATRLPQSTAPAHAPPHSCLLPAPSPAPPRGLQSWPVTPDPLHVQALRQDCSPPLPEVSSSFLRCPGPQRLEALASRLD